MEALNKDAKPHEMELDQKPKDQFPPSQDSTTLQKDRSSQKQLILRKLAYFKSLRRSRIPISSTRVKRKALCKRRKSTGNGSIDALVKTLTEMDI